MLAQARCSGRVPLVTAVLGASAGHGALVAPISDFTVMSRHASIFTAGPPVVLESLGETITKEDLGGPSVALASGLIHNAADDDDGALDLVRALPPLLPDRRRGRTRPTSPAATSGPRLVPEILDIVPRNGRRVYDMRKVIDVVFDAGSCFEVQPEFGKPVICCALPARRPSRSRSSRTNRWRSAGSIDADGADKAAHFITVADSFHLPLVFLSDNPGVLPGSASEQQGDPAQGRAHVRGADARDHAEVRGHAAQGVRLRLDGHGHDPVRRPVGSVRVSRCDDGRDGRGRDEPVAGFGRRRGGDAAPARGRGVVPSAQVVRHSTSSSTRARSATCCCTRSNAALHRRQAPAEPVARIGISP